MFLFVSGFTGIDCTCCFDCVFKLVAIIELQASEISKHALHEYVLNVAVCVY